MKVRSKSKSRKRYLLWAGVSVFIAVVFIVFLLFYKPVGSASASAEDESKVSRYLTHVLAPQFYNGIQEGEPFDLVVAQDGINDIIARYEWPRKFDGTEFSTPVVHFVPDNIVLMGTVTFKDLDFVVTIVVKPVFDEQGLLNLRVRRVNIGAMNITFLAGIIAGTIYQNRVAAEPLDEDDWRARIAASLLNNVPFDPVFAFEDTNVRIEKATITQGKLILRLVPLDI